MSDAMADRVKRAHPLAPSHRMILLYLAWLVPEGATEVIANLTAVARALDTTPQVVSQAVTAGASQNLCHRLKNGRIAFVAYDAPLGVDPPADRPTGVRVATVREDAETPRPSPQAVLDTFSLAWAHRYGKRYPFTVGRDHRLAKALAAVATIEEIAHAAQAYLHAEDAFYGECTHAFSVFHKQFHKFIVAGRQHRPTPTVDAEYERTQAYLRELRRYGPSGKS